MNTLADKWAGFEAVALRGEPSASMRQRMRIAFYAGAASLQELQSDLVRGGLSDDALRGVFQGVRAEVLEFARQEAERQG